jgi:integrase
VNVDGTWWIVFTAAETKGKSHDERPVPQDLAEFIERYLVVHRPILARGKTDDTALWMAVDGKPMSCASVAETIPDTTETTIGVRVSPHLFRTAGVTTLATRASDKPHAGSALLHHRPGPVTQENYNRASCISAGKSIAAMASAWLRRNVRHVCDGGPRCLIMYLETIDSVSSKPSLRSSH